MNKIQLRLYSTSLDQKKITAGQLSLISRKSIGHVDYYRPNDFKVLCNSGHTIVIADMVDGNFSEIAGYCVYSRFHDALLISQLVVDSRFRCFGVGRALIERTKKRVSNPYADVHKIVIAFDDSVYQSATWFEGLGFRSMRNENDPVGVLTLEFSHAAVQKDDHGVGKD